MLETTSLNSSVRKQSRLQFYGAGRGVVLCLRRGFPGVLSIVSFCSAPPPRPLISRLLCFPLFPPVLSAKIKDPQPLTMVLFSRMLARARSVPNKLLLLKVPSRPMSEVAIEVEAGYSTYV